MPAPVWAGLEEPAAELELEEPAGRTVDARKVGCPTCGAPIGVYCRRPSGHKAWSPHAARWDALGVRFDTGGPLEELEPIAGQLELVDPEYADVDEHGQLSLGVAGEQRAIPGLAATRQESSYV